MPIPDAKRQKRLEATREAAAALLEDLQHSRELLRKFPPSSGEIRRLSGILRRLLIEKSLVTVAAPRIGRVLIMGPNNAQHHARIEAINSRKPNKPAPGQTYVLHFGSGARLGRTLSFRAMSIEINTRADQAPGPTTGADKKMVQINAFLKERVILFWPHWVTRGDTIKFMANVASGVHSGTAKVATEHILNGIRHAVVYDSVKGGWRPRLKLKVPAGHYKYSPNSINPVLIEILATAHYVVNSPDVQKLETILKRELLDF